MRIWKTLAIPRLKPTHKVEIMVRTAMAHDRVFSCFVVPSALSVIVAIIPKTSGLLAVAVTNYGTKSTPPLQVKIVKWPVSLSRRAS